MLFSSHNEKFMVQGNSGCRRGSSTDAYSCHKVRDFKNSVLHVQRRVQFELHCVKSYLVV